jgi:hypothetical protein
MPGRESLDLVANGVERLKLGGKVNSVGLLGGPALVESCNADGVAGGNCAVLLLVVKNEREHAIKVLGRVDAIFKVQRDHNLAVRGGLEVVGGLQGLTNKTVVVDFAVDGEDNAVIGIGKWLSSALNADDAEPFMAQNRVVRDNAAAPIRASVSDLLGKL